MANGTERLLKSCLLINYLNENGDYPPKSLWDKGKKGHDIILLLEKFKQLPILDKYSNTCALAAAEIDFLRNNKLIHKILNVLRDYGQSGRYYNLDFLSDPRNTSIEDPVKKWLTIESEVFQKTLNNNAPDLVNASKDAREKTYSKIEKTIKIFMGVFSKLLINGYLGEFGRQLTGFFTKFKIWTKPLIDMNNLRSQYYNKKAKMQ